MFWFKRKTLVVDAFTPNGGVFDYAQIKPAREFIPEWWKKLPTNYKLMMPNSQVVVDAPTMKRCAGFIDLYKTGFILPLWNDLVIEMTAPGSWRGQWADTTAGAARIDFHPIEQFGGFPGFTHLKMVTPWVLQEKTGVEFLWTQPLWNNLASKAKIVPGVVNYKYQNATNINLFLSTNTDRIEFDFGEPMVHIVPLTEHEIKIKSHLLTAEDWEAMHSRSGYRSRFFNVYGTRKEMIDKSPRAACPFHKGDL